LSFSKHSNNWFEFSHMYNNDDSNGCIFRNSFNTSNANGDVGAEIWKTKHDEAFKFFVKKKLINLRCKSFLMNFTLLYENGYGSLFSKESFLIQILKIADLSRLFLNWNSPIGAWSDLVMYHGKFSLLEKKIVC